MATGLPTDSLYILDILRRSHMCASSAILWLKILRVHDRVMRKMCICLGASHFYSRWRCPKRSTKDHQWPNYNNISSSSSSIVAVEQ